MDAVEQMVADIVNSSVSFDIQLADESILAAHHGLEDLLVGMFQSVELGAVQNGQRSHQCPRCRIGAGHYRFALSLAVGHANLTQGTVQLVH